MVATVFISAQRGKKANRMGMSSMAYKPYSQEEGKQSGIII